MRRFSTLILPLLVMSLSTVPIVFASSSYAWSIACSGQGNSTASWYWYQGGPTGTPLTTGQINCNGASSLSGSCPSQGVCSLGRPSNADTLIAQLNVNCGYSYSGSVTKSFAPGAPVSLSLTVTIRHGSCNGTYSKGEETATFKLNG